MTTIIRLDNAIRVPLAGLAPEVAEELRMACTHTFGTLRHTTKAAVSARFFRYVEKIPGGHWLWKGAIGKDGYGIFTYRNADNRPVTLGAHRLSWILQNGPVPDGLFVLHECDTPPCVNPGDLFLGTQADNVADRVAKGRSGRRDPPLGGWPSVNRGESNGMAKLDLESAAAIRALGAEGVSGVEIARRFRVSASAVSTVLRGVRWMR